jgi:hypothetical protein
VSRRFLTQSVTSRPPITALRKVYSITSMAELDRDRQLDADRFSDLEVDEQPSLGDH